MKRIIGVIALLLTLLLAACAPETETGTAAESESAGTESVASDSGSLSIANDELDPFFVDVVNAKAVYTEREIDEEDSRWEQVVASCGDYTMNNRDVQINYCMQYLEFASQYGGIFLDSSKPLSEQEALMPGMTWEQYFLRFGVEQLYQNAALATQAKAEGFTMPEQDSAELKSILEGLPEDAKKYGFDTVNAFIQETFGVGVRQEDYERYLRIFFLSMSYQNSVYENLLQNDAELKAYFDAHPDEFKAVDVRHILIAVETSDENGELSEEEKASAKAEAREKAESLLADFQSNPTEAYFAELAGQHSEDPGSKDNGGLYEKVAPGQMVPTFNDWCFDPARKSGDTGIVETDFGYHVMFFIKQTYIDQWEINAAQSIASTKLQKVIEQTPVTVHYEHIILAPLPSAEETDVSE